MSFECPSVQTPDPRVLLAHFLRQIEARHISTINHPPVMLHYDSKTGALVEYAWPCDHLTEERITPCQLEAVRRTHHFRGPSCLCAFLDRKPYTEARIGVVESVNKDPIRNASVLHGEYVAVCARQRCGYFLCLERFYAIPNLQLQMCLRRARPRPPKDLTHISDVEKSFRQGDGLFQVMSDVNIRGSKRNLKNLDPFAATKQLAGVFEELIRGVTEARFYALFVQCLACKEVMFREFFVTYHVCIHHKAREYHPYRRSNRRITSRILSLRADVPEQASSPTRSTYDSEADYDIIDTDIEEPSAEPHGAADFEVHEVSGNNETQYLSLGSDDRLPTVMELLRSRRSALRSTAVDSQEQVSAGTEEAI